MDDQCPGRPRRASTDGNAEKVVELMRADRRMTAATTADKLGISHGSVHTIVNKDLQLTKVCARRLPRVLTIDAQVKVCTRQLERYQKKSDAFFKRRVTRDETWGHYLEPESKRQRNQRSSRLNHRRRKSSLLCLGNSKGLNLSIARRKVKQ